MASEGDKNNCQPHLKLVTTQRISTTWENVRKLTRLIVKIS